MPEASRRVRAGDVVLIVGCLVFLTGLLAGGSFSFAPAARPSEPASGTLGPSPMDHPSPADVPAALVRPAPASGATDEAEEGVFHPLDSRTIHAWKDLPVHLVHLPHWLAGVEHKRSARGHSTDAKLQDLEFRLRLLGFDSDSIQRGIRMVAGIDRALLDAPPGMDAVQRLLAMARGGDEAAELAKQLEADGGAEAVRIRAIALLAARGDEPAVAGAVLALASSDAARSVRTAAATSLLWMKRQREVADWVATEASPEAVSDFFDTSRSAKQLLDPNRPANVLVFRSRPMVESPALVDTLIEGSAAARWPALTRAKMYGVAAWYGREREDVATWMTDQYGRATSDFIRASILFHAPELAHSRALEDKAIEVVRASDSGLLARTAVGTLGRFETERSFRTLLEVIPRLEGSLAQHAIFSLAGLREWHGAEIQAFLLQLTESHRSEEVRQEARSALARHFK